MNYSSTKESLTFTRGKMKLDFNLSDSQDKVIHCDIIGSDDNNREQVNLLLKSH
jgi:hypothetical protein